MRITLYCAHVATKSVGSVNMVEGAQVVTCWDCSDAIDANQGILLEDGRTVRIG